MTTARTSLALVLAFLTAAGSAFADQQHIVTPQQLTAAMTQKVAAENADRAAVRETLARPEVREVAASMGVDLAKLSGAVDTMSGVDLEAGRIDRATGQRGTRWRRADHRPDGDDHHHHPAGGHHHRPARQVGAEATGLSSRSSLAASAHRGPVARTVGN